MKTSEILTTSNPMLSNAVFILALSDQYGVNRMVAKVLIEHMRAEKFGELYSPHFPDSIIAEDTGLLHLPRCDFYASTLFEPNTVIMTGDYGPAYDDGKANYEVSNTIIKSAKGWGCRRFLSFGAFQGEKSEDRIYVAATSKRLVDSVTERLGGKPLALSRIDGLTGMILGQARIQGLPAICVSGLLEKKNYPDDIAQEIFHYLIDVLRLKIGRG